MKVHDKVEVITSVIRDKITVDVYLIDGSSFTLIDTGINNTPKRDLLPLLTDKGADFSAIEMVLNTHGHPDHIGGNESVSASGAATIGIHKDDAAYLTAPDQCFSRHMEPVTIAMGGDVQKERQMFKAMAGRPMRPDLLFEDGNIVNCGGGLELTVVHLPGHTPGSVGFFWEAEGILFCGDAVPGLHSERGKLPIIMDLKAYLTSLKRLQRLDIHCLLCSHAYHGVDLPPATMRKGSEVKKYLSESLEFAETLYESIQHFFSDRDKCHFIELADRVINNLPTKYGIMPMSKVKMPMITPQAIFFALYAAPDDA